MADALGINIATFYLWERGKPIPKHFELAIKFLATQELPKAQQNRRKPDGGFQTKFAPGARFGRLVVVANVTQEAGRSRHRRVQVQCDCGEWKVMRATLVAGAMECSYHCPLKGTRIPTAEEPAPERGERDHKERAKAQADQDEIDVAVNAAWREGLEDDEEL
jgi:hypothetical protein